MALPAKSLPARPELEALLRQAAARGPMTPAELREQRISWAYGNCGIENPNITRDMVERVHDEIYGKPQDHSR
jgi:hypothetical protein